MGPVVLVDASVWTRVPRMTAVVEALERQAAAAEIVTCPIVDLELLHSARGPAEYDDWAAARRTAYGSLPLTERAGLRALEVQRELAGRGLHRAAKLPDLLIAAIAEQAGAGLLHYDADYDHIAGVTGQPTRWVVKRGSVD
jgi:predicted nucleic acid-binding protein